MFLHQVWFLTFWIMYFPFFFCYNSSTPSWTCCLVDFKVLNLPEWLHHRLLGLMSTRLETCFSFDIFFIFGTRDGAKWHGHKWVRLLDDLPFDVVLILLGFWTHCRKIHTEENRVILYLDHLKYGIGIMFCWVSKKPCF